MAFAFDPGKDGSAKDMKGESIRDIPADFNEVTYTDTDVILGGTGTSHFSQEFDDLGFYPKALTIEELGQLQIPYP